MTSEHQCCFAIWALSDPAWNPLGWQSYVGNPIVAWQYDAVAQACSYHRQRVLQTPSLYGRSAEWVASQKCSATPLTTYFAPERFGCPGFSQAVADLQKAEGVGRYHSGDANMGQYVGYNPTAPPVTGSAPLSERLQFEQWTSALGEASEVYEYVAPVISGGSSVVKFADYNHGARIDYDPAACCAACSANADCIAWQLVGHDLDDYDYDYDNRGKCYPYQKPDRENTVPRGRNGALWRAGDAFNPHRKCVHVLSGLLEDPNLNYIDAADWATSQGGQARCGETNLFYREAPPPSTEPPSPPPPPDEPPSPPPLTCWAWGDPHYHDWWGGSFDVHGLGVNTMATWGAAASEYHDPASYVEVPTGTTDNDCVYPSTEYPDCASIDKAHNHDADQCAAKSCGQCYFDTSSGDGPFGGGTCVGAPVGTVGTSTLAPVTAGTREARAVQTFHCPVICGAHNTADWYPCGASSVVATLVSDGGYLDASTNPPKWVTGGDAVLVVGDDVYVDGMLVSPPLAPGETRQVGNHAAQLSRLPDNDPDYKTPGMKLVIKTSDGAEVSTWKWDTHHMPTAYLQNTRVQLPAGEEPGEVGTCSTKQPAPAPLRSGWVDSVLYDLSQACKVTEYAPSFTANADAPTACNRTGTDIATARWRCQDKYPLDAAAMVERCAYDYCVAGGDGLLGLHADLRYDPLAPKTCKDFTRVDGSAGKLTLLRGVGDKALNDPTRVQIFPRVHTAAGCCEYATRHQCAANPVRAWQLVGKQCVLLRAAYFEMKKANIGDADWDGVPETYIKAETVRELVMRLAKSAPVLDANHAPGGDIFYTDNPKCTGVDPADSGGYDGGGTIAPCREDRAAATCTGNDKELCYYDVTCKRGGLGCNAAGYEMCRFCEFDFSAEGGANYSSVPCPRTAAAPGYAVEVQLPGAACPSTCTSDPTDTCYYDASCSDPMVDGTGCHAGGHKNCRFCGLAAAAGWVGSGAVRDCPQLDLQLITGAADASTSTGAQAAQLDPHRRAGGDDRAARLRRLGSGS